LIYAFGSGSASSGNGGTVSITDVAGRTVQVPAQVNKVVGTGCSGREIVYLNASDKMVGIEQVETNFTGIGSTLPYIMAHPELMNLPVVGDGSKNIINYEEIAKGATKTIRVKKYITCKQCNGSGARDRNSSQTCHTCGGTGQVRKIQNTFLGQMQTVTTCPTCNGEGTVITNKCPHCKGSGRVFGEEDVTIEIPAGVSAGMQLSMSGKGNVGERGGAPGDLIILIEEEKHPQLQREGNNVAFDLYISFTDAVFGIQVEVPTIDGRAKIKVPAGTQSGKIFRLKGKGFPSLDNHEVGDQLIHVNVWTPQNISPQEKTALESLQNSDNFKPHPDKNEKGFWEKIRETFS
jgi:molecular chaperone DnaJ